VIHRYEEIQIATMKPDGSALVSEGEPGAACGVVFAAVSLDPEFSAAAMIESRGAWLPLSGKASPDRLAELQSDARAAYNGHLAEDGTVTPLAPQSDATDVD
jgi:hypothetical protein